MQAGRLLWRTRCKDSDTVSRASLHRFWRNETGATVIEYCLIASIIAMATVTGLTIIGTKLNHIFQQIAAVN